jgi:glycosyltransferase involved in cell wall biosynthesis
LHSVLSHFRPYFDPHAAAPLANHSAGQIARHLYELLTEYGDVDYLGNDETPSGMAADLFVGHFWAFDRVWRPNSFRKKVAFYPASDARKRRALLAPLADQFGVPFPEWDFPPEPFDHQATMDAADLVLVVGNRTTLNSFPERWHGKIRCLNYSVDGALYGLRRDVLPKNEFCYIATECGLRKGFMDVLRTWSGIRGLDTRLHTIGLLDERWQRLLRSYQPELLLHHGWIDSHSEEYVRLLQSCKFAFIPTYSEGQMGSLLEAIYCGCVPITTRESGIDERVLEHCVIVEPLHIEQQRDAVLQALRWTEQEYSARQEHLLRAARTYQTWDLFRLGVSTALAELGFSIAHSAHP